MFLHRKETAREWGKSLVAIYLQSIIIWNNQQRTQKLNTKIKKNEETDIAHKHEKC